MKITMLVIVDSLADYREIVAFLRRAKSSGKLASDFRIRPSKETAAAIVTAELNEYLNDENWPS